MATSTGPRWQRLEHDERRGQILACARRLFSERNYAAVSTSEIAREAGVDGVVMVQALVGKDGKVKDTRVVKSIPMLDASAIAAVKQWVFKPALSNNKPVAVWVAVPMKFTLH